MSDDLSEKLKTPEYMDELMGRAEAIRWMRKMEWCEELQDSIFMDNTPPLQHVRDIVYRHGPEKAYKILLTYLE